MPFSCHFVQVTASSQLDTPHHSDQACATPLLMSAEHSSACCLQELTTLKGEQKDGQHSVQVLLCHTHKRVLVISGSPGVALCLVRTFCVLLLLLCMLLLENDPSEPDGAGYLTKHYLLHLTCIS